MKRLIIVIALFLTLLLNACTPDESNDSIDTSFLDIYHTNDVHGAIEADGPDTLGLGRMANLMRTKNEDHPDNTLLLDGGDAFQGSALSNYYEGESYIELMNAIGYDAMVVGNHEFDWGLETVTDYFAEDGIADFPLLGANIIDEKTGEIPENVDPYAVFERAGRTIGVIGTIGYGLEGTIAPSMVEGYRFEDPAPIVEAHAETLREEEGADLVLLLTHDPGDVNDEVLAFEGDARIDGIFNAHHHNEETYESEGVPILQSGGYGSHVGHMKFTWEDDERDVDLKLLNTENESLLQSTHPEVQDLIDAYADETDSIFKEPIIDNDRAYGRGELSEWIAGLMRHATDADIGFQNFGGTRTDLDDGAITLGDLYEIWPFENSIKTVHLKGEDINNLMDELVYQSSRDDFEDDTTYKVVTNDYVFDQSYNPFLEGEDPKATDLFIRDLAEEELTLQSDVYDRFQMDNPFLIEPTD